MKIEFNGPLLVVSAHPDDMELMAGGLIARATSQGVDVYSIVISDGCENGDIEVRKKEMLRSSKILGVKNVKACGIKDGRIPHNIDMVNMVDSYIDEVNPSVIITHTDHDTHQDHKNVCNITLSSARCRPGIVLMGETPSSRLTDDLVYFDITDSMSAKIKSLKEYRSQIKHGPVDIDYIKTLGAFHGNKVRVKYAEAFKVWRMLL